MKVVALCSVVTSLLLAAEGAPSIVNRATSKTLVTKKLSVPRRAALELRGGAGPFDPEAVAKVYTCLFCAQSMAMNMNAKKALTMSGVSDKDNTPVAQIVMEFVAQSILELHMMPLLMLLFGTSFRTAYAISNLLGAYYSLEYMLNDKLPSNGFSSNNGPKVAFVLHLLPAIAVLKDMEFADALIKVSMAVWGLSGVQLAFAPKEAAKSWNLAAPLTQFTEALTKTVGQLFIGAVIFQAAVFQYDQPVLKAFGLSLIPSVLGHAWSLLDGSAKKTGVSINSYYFYTVVNALTIAATLL